MLWFKKKERSEFKPSRFVKDHIIAHNEFSEIDKMKLMMSHDLVKKINISISYDVLADALKLLDDKYHAELENDLKYFMPKPPKEMPTIIKKEKDIPDKDLLKKELMKELLNEIKSSKTVEIKNGIIQDSPVEKEQQA